MKKFLHEFKAFALKGNVMDLAVGVIIGAAFQSIVTSLTNDILNPLLGIAFSTDFSNVVLPRPTAPTRCAWARLSRRSSTLSSWRSCCSASSRP